jgi:hypothetical protein
VLPYSAANVALVALQALVVALPGAGWPARLPLPRGRGWALLAPLSIAVVVAAIAALPGVASGLTWLALVAVPPLAAAALGWAARFAHPALALLAVALFAGAWALLGTPAGDACAALLTALSCVTLGRLLAGLTPAVALQAGIVVMAIIDTALIVSDNLQGPNAVLVAAAPAPTLPRLQAAVLNGASLGYGDLFVAGLLGGVLALQRGPGWRAAALTFAFSLVMDLLFWVADTLPATVPVALALLTLEGARRLSGSAPASRAAPGGTAP